MAGKRKPPVTAQRLISQGLGAVLFLDFSEPCPKRGGPDHPHPDHPGLVGYLTCRGCRYRGPSYLDGFVCTHDGARAVAAAALRRAVERERAKREGPDPQMSLF